MTIKKCTLADLTSLQAVAIETYRDTFSETNSDHIMQQYLDSAMSLAKLKMELDCSASHFYFIYHNQELAGFMKLNELAAQTDIYDSDAIELERFYIRNKYHGQGLGKKLMTSALQFTRQRAKAHLWLGVWEHNYAALAFYQKQGFSQVGQHPFDMGGDIQTDLIYRKTLI